MLSGESFLESTLIFRKESSKYSEISLNINLSYTLEITGVIFGSFNPFIHNFEKWSNIL